MRPFDLCDQAAPPAGRQRAALGRIDLAAGCPADNNMASAAALPTACHLVLAPRCPYGTRGISPSALAMLTSPGALNVDRAPRDPRVCQVVIA